MTDIQLYSFWLLIHKIWRYICVYSWCRCCWDVNLQSYRLLGIKPVVGNQINVIVKLIIEIPLVNSNILLLEKTISVPTREQAVPHRVEMTPESHLSREIERSINGCTYKWIPNCIEVSGNSPSLILQTKDQNIRSRFSGAASLQARAALTQSERPSHKETQPTPLPVSQ